VNKYPGIVWFIITVLSVSIAYAVVQLFFKDAMEDYIHFILPLASSIANAIPFYYYSKKILAKNQKRWPPFLLTLLLMILNYIALYMPYIFLLIIHLAPLAIIYSLLLLLIPLYDLFKNSNWIKIFEKIWIEGKQRQ
jgi:hypothetical protein